MIGGAVLLYAAWWRGLISLPAAVEERLPHLALPLPDDADGLALEDEEGTGDSPALQLLGELETFPQARLRQLRQAVDQLNTASEALDRVERLPAPEAVEESARAGQLADLNAALPLLLEAYDSFEDAAGKAEKLDTEGKLAELRELYVSQLERFIDLLGRSYLRDPEISRTDYMLVEQLQQRVALRGRVPAERLRDRWLAAVTAREQLLLDARFTAEYEGLAARQATLHQLRRQFNEAAKALGPLNDARGELSSESEALLELYDAFAYKLEDLWDEWAVYEQTMPPVAEQPKRMAEEIKQIRETFYTEHLDCFTQMYTIYSRDRELTHPAYEHLIGDHYIFVQAEWESRAPIYKAVALQFEAEWDRYYRSRRDEKEVGISGGSQLKGPPGYDPSTPGS